MIVRTKEGFRILSEKGKPLSRYYDTLEEAEARLREIEMFKHMRARKTGGKKRMKKIKRISRRRFTRLMFPVSGSRRRQRDADNPRVGEMFQNKAGQRWKVLGVTDRLVTVERAGYAPGGPYPWGRSMLKKMKSVPEPTLLDLLFSPSKPQQPEPTEPSLTRSWAFGTPRDPDDRSRDRTHTRKRAHAKHRRAARRRRLHRGLWGLSKRAGVRLSDLDPRELARGTRVEMEHTERRIIARRIAADHLTEDPRYYQKLARMEGHARDPRGRGKRPARRPGRKAKKTVKATGKTARKKRKAPARRVAVIIKDRLAWTSKNKLAVRFYDVLSRFLKREGFAVTVAAEEGKNRKDPRAHLRIVHGRTLYRSKLGPKARRTVMLGSPRGISHPKDDSARKRPLPRDKKPNRYHWVLTKKMQMAILEAGKPPRSGPLHLTVEPGPAEGSYCTDDALKERAKRKEKPPHKCTTATQMMTLVFDKHCWTLEMARDWARLHNHKPRSEFMTDDKIRLRLLSGNYFRAVGSMPIKRGLDGVLGCPIKRAPRKKPLKRRKKTS